MKKLFVSALVLMFFVPAIFAQNNSTKVTFYEAKGGYWDTIQKGIDTYLESVNPKLKKPSWKADFSGISKPSGPADFKFAWHNKPESQGRTGTCWCFSTTSFFESEVKRLTGKEVQISELYTVYWEYVEKALRYAQERGNSALGEGSQGNAVQKNFKKYGAVPYSAYSGMLPGQKFIDHQKLFEEFYAFLTKAKENNTWAEGFIENNVKAILNKYMGAPPDKFDYEGKTYTPETFLKNYLQINPDDYVALISVKNQPYGSYIIYDVPDNWWRNSDYYNIPLDDFMQTLKDAVKKGYTVALAGDVSEPGINGFEGVGIIPDFDIKPADINEDSRIFRFLNGQTTDDHGIHCVGSTEKDGVTWFLIRESAAGSFNSPNPGYMSYREDYVKLKMMSYMIHKSAVKGLK
ncbi:MAG: peptidase C1 [Bacteroidetes bacterium]|nr:peptidase C1 [Bacteroidota bacterium]